MACNCVFAVHRALERFPQWPLKMREVGSGPHRRDFERLKLARAFHHVMQLACQKCNLTSSTAVLLHAESPSDWIRSFGRTAVQASRLLNAIGANDASFPKQERQLFILPHRVPGNMTKEPEWRTVRE